MLVKEITYFDLYGEELTEKFYFNLRQDEAVDVHLSEDGGLDAFIERIMTERNGKELVRLFKDFILKLVGQVAPDGKRFIKTKEYTDWFSQTAAYTELWRELVMDPEAASEFINAALEKPRADRDKPNEPPLPLV